MRIEGRDRGRGGGGGRVRVVWLAGQREREGTSEGWVREKREKAVDSRDEREMKREGNDEERERESSSPLYPRWTNHEEGDSPSITVE